MLKFKEDLSLEKALKFLNDLAIVDYGDDWMEVELINCVLRIGEILENENEYLDEFMGEANYVEITPLVNAMCDKFNAKIMYNYKKGFYIKEQS